MRDMRTPDTEAVLFDDAAEFRAWLVENHARSDGLWVLLAKKHVPEPKLDWPRAVREALCFGWIDSQSRRLDADYTVQRFTPRRPGSIWARTNIAAVEELTAAGLMHPAGLAAYEARRADRMGVYSFEAEPSELPGTYVATLEANPRAALFWATATPGYRKVVTHWVMSAKQEATRDRRMAQLVADSAAGELVPMQRYGEEPGWLARARAALEAADGTDA
ncbi:MAG TPA: YdeI/OmpD-associated family protein [Propionibacteriaceae bacterium]|nr:YdeI/OmpD-associated family protein [Propionibacteriaceae bacterium]